MRSEIKLYNKNCMEAMRKFKDNEFNIAIVDPPYFSGPEKRGFYGKSIGESKHSKTGRKSLVVRVEYSKSEKWKVPDPNYFKELRRVSKNQIIWGINYFLFQSYAPGRIIWDKVNYKTSFSDCEIALCTFHDSVRQLEYMWNGMMQGESLENGRKQQGNKKLNEKRIHPTQKPVKLYKWLLQKYAKEGDSILDTHAGSCSLALACWDLKRDFIGYEIDKEYFDNAVKRLTNHQRQEQLF